MHIVLVVLLFTAGMCQGMPGPASSKELLDYLYQYGYLPATDLEKGMQRSERDLEQAIMRLQKFGGLEMTGKADGPTMDLIGMPRCGVPDMFVKDDDVLGVVEDEAPSNYSLYPRKWNAFPVTYGFENFTPDLDESVVRADIISAFDKWTEVSGLSLEEVDANDAEIPIRFGSGSHGCNYPFTGPGGVLAHAFYPRNGDMHFDEDEDYTSGVYSGTNLHYTALHEMGHSFGIKHSPVRDSIMYPYYKGYVENLQLHEDDIGAIQALYGSGE